MHECMRPPPKKSIFLAYQISAKLQHSSLISDVVQMGSNKGSKNSTYLYLIPEEAYLGSNCSCNCIAAQYF